MEDKERQSAFLSALNTELFVLQAALGANVNEAGARASIYIMALSSFLVAMGFASRSEAFGPLVASVLPALFLLGLFTVVRLVDLNGSYLQHDTRMARIRSYYRGLSPEADSFFGLDLERRPEVTLQLGWGVAFLTTSSSMVAFINNIVAGAGITLLARRLLGAENTLLGLLLGVAGALALTAAYLAFQKLRFRMFEPVPQDRATGAKP
ncbi:MAG TPA: hypothetical protein VKG01_07395 [Thermoanaerobaculia bacterium]|nr:hypothetical protein [Thermoanaerobaculia bacterium]